MYSLNATEHFKMWILCYMHFTAVFKATILNLKEVPSLDCTSIYEDAQVTFLPVLTAPPPSFPEWKKGGPHPGSTKGSES